MVVVILKSLCFALSVRAAVLVACCTADAHQVDEYLQAALVEIDARSVRLHLHFTPGVEVADAVLDHIDRDGDSAISPAEAERYAEMVGQDLSVRLDGHDVKLNRVVAHIPAPSELRTGWGVIEMEYAIELAALNSGPHQLKFQNRHLPGIAEYLFNAARPTSGYIQIDRQNRSDDQGTGDIEFTVQPSRITYQVGVVTVLAAVAVATAAWRLRDRRIRKHAPSKRTVNSPPLPI
jgi:hypothetical protein